MSYRAGTIGLEPLGIPSGPPRIICDGCALWYPIGERRPPPQWFFDGKAPPKWKRVDAIGETDKPVRRDYCPSCAPAHAGEKGTRR